MSKPNENIYAELRRRVMAGRYEPGEQLKEEALATELGVSRTPVRAALKRLVTDGLLESHANRGAFVAQWTNNDISEVVDLRCMLESEAAARAAEHATKEQVTMLTVLNQKMHAMAKRMTSDKIADMQVFNNQFHKTILAAAGSARLSAATRGLIDWPLTVGSFYVFSDADIARSLHYHDDLIAAIGSGDTKMARCLMEAHLRRSYLAYRTHRK